MPARPLSPKEDRICELVCKLARPLILTKFREDSCIASTKIGKRILDHYGIDCKPVTVRIDVFNPQYSNLLRERGRPPQTNEEGEEWKALGAWNVSIDNEDIGHVILLVRDCMILDLSLDQMSRPHKGIELQPSGFSVDTDFIKKQNWTVFQNVYNCVVRYVAQPENKTFSRSREWTIKSRTTEIVHKMIAVIDKILRAEG